MRSVTIALALFFYFLSFTSCLIGEEEMDSPERTILVYIGRDNDLSGNGENKRDAIIEGWNGRGGHLVIYQDLPEGAKLEVIYRKKSKNLSRVLYERAEENSATAEVFQDVIERTIAECPAQSYGLIVFSHASGWLPDATLSSPRSIIKDNKDWMNLPDFANAIPDNLFEFIVFEACFMGGVEVAYELKDKTNYILGSPAEILSPGFRDVYRTSVNLLFLPDAGLQSFSEELYSHLEKETFSSVTLSLIRTSFLHELAEWVRLNTNTVEYPSTTGMQVFDRNNYHLFFDFEQHFARMTNNDIARAELAAILNNCLIGRYYTPTFLLAYNGFRIDNYSGLTTYINQQQYPYLNEEYKKTKWAQAIAR